jgi:hypothetical protein
MLSLVFKFKKIIRLNSSFLQTVGEAALGAAVRTRHGGGPAAAAKMSTLPFWN